MTAPTANGHSTRRLFVWRDVHFHLLPTVWIRPARFIFGEPFPGAIAVQWLHRGLGFNWKPRSAL